MASKIEKEAKRSHKDRVAELNAYLEKLSEVLLQFVQKGIY